MSVTGLSLQIADHLADVGISVDRIEHSEKLRTRQTAEILTAI